nr:serine:threonine protein kinase rio2 [Hymenolepis microstoma]
MPKSIKIDQFRYMSSEAWRVLMAVEMGMKNHEFVPLDLVHKISKCTRRGSSFLKLLRDDLVPHGLLAYETDNKKGYSGYRLTNLGYDYLALHTLIKSGQICDLGSIIGVGKESDVYLAVAGETCGRHDEKPNKELEDKEKHTDLPVNGEYIVIKFHRLGRTSFRKVREKREYHQGRNTCSWLYLDRLAAKREYEMMQILYDDGLPVPCPLANNRNAVVMSLIPDAVPLCKVLPATLRAGNASLASSLYSQAKEILAKITAEGLVHGDFNEFNLLISGLVDELGEETGDAEIAKRAKLVLIDFPQMISRDHWTAQEIYERDLDGILSFFGKFLDIAPDEMPPRNLKEIPRTGYMDIKLKAPGYSVQKKSKDIKKGGKSRQVDDSELLVGTVAALALKTEKESDENESELGTSEENSISGEDSDDESEDSEEDSDSGNDEAECAKSLAGKNASISITNKQSAAQTILSQEEIRERKRREDRRRAQREFLLAVKRQQRASKKSKLRAEIETEAKMFG